MLVRKENKIICRRSVRENNRFKRYCRESFDSEDSFNSAFNDLVQCAKRMLNKYGKDVTDEINVVFWAKDGDGTPCLVNGAYNYWSGDAELTLTEIADGEKVNNFVKKIDAYIKKEPDYLKEYLVEDVVNNVVDEFDLDINSRDLLDKIGNTTDYKSLYRIIKGSLNGISEEDFFDFCYSAEENSSFDSGLVEYGWTYSTVNQGNLWYGRSNSVKGLIFCEDIFASRDSSEAYVNDDINQKGLEDLARKIKNGTQERLRY